MELPSTISVGFPSPSGVEATIPEIVPSLTHKVSSHFKVFCINGVINNQYYTAPMMNG
jgi:hypothetical protein